MALVTVFTGVSHLALLLQILTLTQVLGPQRYAIFAFGLTLQSYLLWLSSLGVRAVTVREGIQAPEKLDQLFTTHQLVTGSLSSLLAVATITVAGLAPVGHAERGMLALLAVGNVCQSMNIQPLFDVHHRQAQSALLVLTAEALALGFMVTLASQGLLGLVAAGAVFAGKWVLSNAAHLALYHYRVRPLRLNYSGDVLRTVFTSAWPVTIANMVATVPFTAGVILVRFSHGEVPAALMALGQHAAGAFLFLATMSVRVVQPHLAALGRFPGGPVWRLAALHGGFMGVLAAGAVGAAWVVVRFLLGPQYADAFGPMALMLGAAFVASLGMFAGSFLMVHREGRVLVLANALGAALYLAAGAVVVPHFSYPGAVALSGCASLLAAVLLTAGVCRPLWRHRQKGD
jgi:O-antigen/teichoic acid export membrane protein